jgi:hypothetical protein
MDRDIWNGSPRLEPRHMPGIPSAPDSKSFDYRGRRNEFNQYFSYRADHSWLIGADVGGFSYTRETREAKIDSLELSIKDTQTVDVPDLTGTVAVVGSGVLLLVARKKSKRLIRSRVDSAMPVGALLP